MTTRLNKVGLLLVAIVGASTFTYGCKKSTSENSRVKMDDQIAQAIDSAGYGGALAKDICGRYPIFFFIGNAETAVTTYRGRNTDSYVSGEAGKDPFFLNVKFAAEGLRHALANAPTYCEEYWAQSGKDYRALLVSVVDGPVWGDTEVTSTWYYFDKAAATADNKEPRKDENGNAVSKAWFSEAPQSWDVDFNTKLTLKKDTQTPIEVHLPIQLEGIVRHFIALKPPGKPDFKFDQSFYFFKSHGGRFKQSDGDLTNAQLFEASNNPIPPVGELNHAFLFDAYGPGSKSRQASSLSTGSISYQKGCTQFAQLPKDQYKSNKALCGKCGPFIKDLTEKGPFTDCANAGPSAKLPKKEGELNAYDNDTLNTYNASSLNAYDNDTLNAYDNDTLNAYDNDTLSVSMPETLGSGKSLLMYNIKNEAAWDNFAHVNTGVVYAGQTVPAGMYKVNLPLLGKEKSIPLIILDSCWGSTKIVTGAFSFEEGSPKEAVMLVNPKPMAIAAVKYGALNYYQYLAFPFIQANAFNNPSSSLAEVKKKIDQHIQVNGLRDAKGGGSKENYQPALFYFKDGNSNRGFNK